MEQHVGIIARELSLDPGQIARTLELLDGGATVPFVARCRKEATGNLDEVQTAGGITNRQFEALGLRFIGDRQTTEEKGRPAKGVPRMTVLAPGTLINRTWRLVRPLGEGGMGVVWAAEHAQLGRTAALKFLRVEFAADVKSLQRFRQEAVAASRIGSPHIVGMLDSGTAPDGSPFLVMELLEGETLWEAMDGGAARLPVARAADILGQALTGVGAAHAQGIVHRDLKPENIFLTRLGERPDFVKLLDFGLALVRSGEAGSRLTQTGVFLGTPSYMAPEQILGAKDVDHRADLWALGVILFRCLTARRPFDGPTPADRIAAAVSRPPTPLRALRPELDETLATIVQRALARRPEQRFQTAEEFRAALAPYAAGCWSPYATSALAPAMIPAPVPSSAAVPTAAVVAPSVPPPGFSSAPGASHAPTRPAPLASRLPPAGRPRRLWPWAVAALAVILAGAGVGWLVAHGGRGAPPSASTRPGLSDGETFVRNDLDVIRPGPDGDSPEARKELFLTASVDRICELARRRLADAALTDEQEERIEREVLAGHGLTNEQYRALAAEVGRDENVNQELERRADACVDRAWTEAGIDPRAVLPPLPVPLALPPGGTGDPERDLYVLITAERDCRTDVAGNGQIRRVHDVGPRVEKYLLLAHERTVAWHMEQIERSESDPAIELLIDRLAADCVTRNRAAGAGASVVEATVPATAAGVATTTTGSGLPADPAAQLELFVAINFALQCAGNADDIVGHSLSHEEYQQRFAEQLASRGLTTQDYFALNERVLADSAVGPAFAALAKTSCPPPVDADGNVLSVQTLREHYLAAAEASDCAAGRLFLVTNGNDPVRAAQVRNEALAALGMTTVQFEALDLRFIRDQQTAEERERRRRACLE